MNLDMLKQDIAKASLSIRTIDSLLLAEQRFLWQTKKEGLFRSCSSCTMGCFMSDTAKNSTR